ANETQRAAAFRAFYQLYRLLFFLLTGHRISFGNFSVIPIAAARRLVAMSELWVDFPATLIRSRLPIIELPTERAKRYQDKSRMNFISLITLGFGAVSTFIDSALTRIFIIPRSIGPCCLMCVRLGIRDRLQAYWNGKPRLGEYRHRCFIDSDDHRRSS